MLIGFVTSGLSFTGDTPKKQALGGSETALVSVSRELAKRGHQVVVFCNCPQPGIYDGVEYHTLQNYANYAAMVTFDVLVASRWGEFLAVPSHVGLRVLWLHDVLTDAGKFAATVWNADLIMGLSDYHINDYCGPPGTPVNWQTQEKKVPGMRPYFWKTSNGIDWDLIKQNIRPTVSGKMIYTSRPERGLLYLLRDVWPRLLKAKSNLRLHFCSYVVGRDQLPDPVRAIHEQCDALAKQLSQSVRDMGPLPKSGLYQQMSSAQLLLYPTNFPEISCLTALESQAMGTPMVTTNGFALTETAGFDTSDGGCVGITGDPEDSAYIEEFVEKTLYLLDNPDAYQELAEAGPKFIERRGYSWDKVAESWDKKFSGMLTDRYKNNKAGVIRELLRTNDVSVAKILAKKENLPELEEEADRCIREVTNREYDPGLVGQQPKKPKTLLDVDCDDVAFGFVAKKKFPDLQVTLKALDENAAIRLRSHVKQFGMEGVEVVEEMPDAKFDMVFLGKKIDEQSDPQSYVARIRKRHLAENGYLGLTARYGTQQLRTGGTPDRLWNFNSIDFKSIFGTEGGTYNLALHHHVDDQSGEITGMWYCLVLQSGKLGKVNIQAKAHRTRPYQTLDLGMIVQDEEDWLPGCLKLLRPITDRIVIVDGGSTDKTIAIAKEFCAEVFSVPFEDFSRSRNVTRDKATGDWFLWLDADERLINAGRLLRYLKSTIFEGYAIRQNHLMLDTPKSHDLPIRLLRNREHYRFSGCIHEHCEDKSKGLFDNSIVPTLVMDDVDIAHYGYTNESGRRQKCSFRNLGLLLKDIDENASRGRILTWLLVMRDYINILKWRAERTRFKVGRGTIEHELLNACITTHLHKFAAGDNKYSKLALGIYRDALMLLGANGLCYHDRKVPPFQAELGLAGGVGGMGPQSVKPDREWFLDEDEFLTHLRKKGAELVTRLGVCRRDKFVGEKPWTGPDQLPPLPNAKQLLSLGVEYTNDRP
jgi:glycosyltransferase involved in cell wall biosynthesis